MKSPEIWQKKKNIWGWVLKNLGAEIPESDIETWFATTRLTKLTRDTAIIEVPNKFVATWLKQQYGDYIVDALEKTLAYRPQVLFELPSRESTNSSEEEKGSFALNKYLNPLLTFKHFLIGEGNTFAYSCATAVAEGNCKVDYNPLYLFSKSSLGKTHLLNAIGNQVNTRSPGTRVKYITTDRFTSQFSNALRTGNIQRFRKYHSNLDLLLLDDIHQISGKTKVQQELISLLDVLFKENKQVVLAGKFPPNQILDLDERLASRLSSGLISEIRLVDRKTRMRIVEQKAKQEHINIPEDVAFFLANTGSDIKELIKNVVRVVSHSSLYGDSLTISNTKALLENTFPTGLSVQRIQRVTAEHFNISLSDMVSPSRSRSINYARQIAMYLCRKLMKLSFEEIGRYFGGRNHATVIHAVKRIEQDENKDNDSSNHLQTIQDLLH